MNTKAKNAEQDADKGGAAASAGAQTLAAQAAPQPQAKGSIATVEAAAGTALVPAPASPTAQAPDEHHGQGGLYQLIDGQRVLVAKTKAPD